MNTSDIFSNNVYMSTITLENITSSDYVGYYYCVRSNLSNSDYYDSMYDYQQEIIAERVADRIYLYIDNNGKRALLIRIIFKN